MKYRKLFLYILIPWFIFMLLSAVVFRAVSVGNFENFINQQTEDELLKHAEYLAKRVSGVEIDAEEIDTGELQYYSDKMGIRITLIKADGTVLWDSHEEASSMDNHRDRPEFMQAIDKVEHQSSIRFSYTIEKKLIYLAYPLPEASDNVTMVLRVSMHFMDLRESIRNYDLLISRTFFIILVLLVLAAYFISRQISKPLEKIRDGAENLANGDYSLRMHPNGAKEIRELAGSFNNMAAQTQNYIKQLQERSNDLNMLLSSMQEGVIAIDKKERILWINNVAAGLFGLDSRKSIGEPVFKLIREADIQEFTARSLKNSSDPEERISLVNSPGHHFIISSAPVINADQRDVGLILVLRDITRLEKLESVRKDFVANVSHELKTPITTIQGYSEALIDGEPKDESMQREFIETILKNARRMNSIINDLIDLARLEREGDALPNREIVKAKDVLSKLLEDYQKIAEKKKIGLESECRSDEVKISVNTALMRQAIGNILDNALKYSEENTRIMVNCHSDGDSVILTVQDEGIGIPNEALPRIFERFYRVDKARSRKEGGTGLGLSIAKHIVQAHNGHIDVESRLGKGSAFRIILPKSMS